MLAIKTRWINLAACLTASAVLILLAHGIALVLALLLPLMSWWAAERPDSPWSTVWIVSAIAVWFVSRSEVLWHAAFVALSIAVVHIITTLGARGPNNAQGLRKNDLKQIGVYLGAVIVAMGVIGAAMLLPQMHASVWILAAVALLGSALVLVRFSASRR